jgi:ABC-type phosphate transport system substrate-binding protein
VIPMTRRFPWLAALLFSLVEVHAAEDGSKRQFVVIVNKQNPVSSLTTAKLKTIFLRKIARWPWGAEIYPADLPAASSLRRDFVKQILSTSPDELSVYWIDQKATRNAEPPEVAPNLAAMKALVASRPGAIGYIPISALDGTVKVVEIER